MRVTILLLCFILCLCLTPIAFADDVVINETIFPDSNFRRYVSANIDRNGDGRLNESEIDRRRSLSVRRGEIRSLKGIEFFTALTSLDCGDNWLSSLDVSSNTALTELYCNDNQLTSLNVSGNTALIRLECYSNQLTSLDISNNTALTNLDCSGNQLTSLNVSNNTALTNLDCSCNQLTSLDVNNNTALTELYCSENQLSSLDVSSNTVLTWLYCSENQLGSLGVSNNTALTGLFCWNNQLTSLDVNSNTALIRLECYDNELTSLDIRFCDDLQVLSCQYNNIATIDISNCLNLFILVVSENTPILFDPDSSIRYGDYNGSHFIVDEDTIITPAPDLVLPASLKTIGEEAFSGGTFHYVQLSEQTESIGPFAFADCRNLKYICIPNPNTTIDENAFGDLQGLVILGYGGYGESTAGNYAHYHDFDFINLAY